MLTAKYLSPSPLSTELMCVDELLVSVAEDVNRMDIGPLLARSANARDTASAARRDSRDETGECTRTAIFEQILQ